jgi:hypothetical protein
MDSVKIDITGDRLVGLRFDEFPTDLHDALLEQIDGLTSELRARARASPRKPRATCSGKLRQRVYDDEHKITGRVDIASDDPRITARLARSNMVQRSAREGQGSWHEAGPLLERQARSPITVLTKAYNRVPAIAEHAFERGALAAMQPAVLSTLNAVVERAVQKANA